MKKNNENNNTLISGKAIGERLSSLLRSRRITEIDLAVELDVPGLSDDDIIKFEKGTGQISFENIRRIADGLGTSVAYILAQSSVDIPEKYAKAYPF